MRAVEFYEQFDEPQNEIYRHLAALPFSLTIATTPDPFWPDALRQEQKEPGVARYHLRGKRSDSNPSLMPAERRSIRSRSTSTGILTSRNR